MTQPQLTARPGPLLAGRRIGRLPGGETGVTAPSWSLGPHRPGKVPGPGPGYAGQDQKDWKLAMAMNTAVRAIENMEYVRRLLRRKQPGFAASLELAASQLGRELREPVMAAQNGAPHGAAQGKRPLTPAVTVTPASCAASVIVSCTWGRASH